MDASKTVLLAHGSGGKLSQDLVRKMFVGELANETLSRLDDAACFSLNGGRLAFTTDSYVVSPIFFPGGDIGKLAVCGTVNDLATAGAAPKFLSLAFIIEEGLPLEDLARVVNSIKAASSEAGVCIVTGDTKVVNRGKADRLFINTSGVGIVPDGINISGCNAKPGDIVMLSGSIGDHGMAIMAQREGFNFKVPVESDCAPLNGMVTTMLEASKNIHVLRDPTRGGLATTLNEIAAQSNVGIDIDETKIPVKDAVGAACELLGFDPLYVANEGKMIAIVAPEDADKVLEAMRRNSYGSKASIIGEVVSGHPGRVVLKTALGARRIVDMLSGELLPRIC
ncbi:hydrogenase expression/formation protein HypE [Dehalogenimonas alkenigignens]|uniref:Hydrogenase maturation protein, carbamoyl dehydratase HypE n=1 Tax=Dehalogenimonas alkenigignens TaxID=1217799 RepID=A0A0W0GG98_9CHLR|nr:hydrogenase expression/formation protein HypE [Dehalogenimonas alkenigignens]KTB47584.1 Hydrogenase maturation protein, carbamoyl dehydratase HypE [Dehalogenimonas alkenigignens]PVV82873.1 hydrogenase expression/formation protein HypE [Dehalogenimonas alkenigignens]